MCVNLERLRSRPRWLLLSACLLLPGCVGAPLLIVPVELPNAAEGSSYSQALSADTTTALRWDISSGTLPAGLALSRGDGVIAGTPTTFGTFDFTVSVGGIGLPPRNGSQVYTLTVIKRLGIQGAIDPARVSVAYDDGPTISGGVPPYSVTIVGLPGFLTCDTATGRITGTLEPLENFDYQDARLEWTVTDSGSPRQTASTTATLEILPVGVAITTTELDDAPIGQAYQMTVEATDGLQPYTWEISAGVLPGSSGDADPLGLNQHSGVITGTPAAGALTATFTIKVTDADDPASTDTREFKLVIPVATVTTALDAATIGVQYDETLGAVGGTGTYTWTLSAGTLPTGLTLDGAAGTISGTPEAGAATATFTLQVSDDDSPAQTADVELTIEVN